MHVDCECVPFSVRTVYTRIQYNLYGRWCGVDENVAYVFLMGATAGAGAAAAVPLAYDARPLSPSPPMLSSSLRKCATC